MNIGKVIPLRLFFDSVVNYKTEFMLAHGMQPVALFLNKKNWQKAYDLNVYWSQWVSAEKYRETITRLTQDGRACVAGISIYCEDDYWPLSESVNEDGLGF